MLKIKNLHATVAGKPILNGLTLTVPTGEIHAIMGPNGAGKSTLAHVLAGKADYEVTEGQVLFAGEDLLGLSPDERAAKGARNFTNCDSLLIGDQCGAHTVPYIEAKNSAAVFEHEATTSKISEEMLFYCRQRGLSAEEAVALVVNGFVKDVLQQLPMEFAVEAQKLISISLEGSVG